MVLLSFTLLLGLLSIVGFSRILWWFTAADFFRLQYAALALILSLVCLFFARWDLAVLNLMIVVLNIYRARYFSPFLPKPTKFGKTTVLSVNIYKENNQDNRLANLITEADPDVLLLMELTYEMEQEIDSVLKQYEYTFKTGVRDSFQIRLLSKLPMENTKVTTHGPGHTPMIHADIMINGMTYQVFATHPKPALNKDWHEERHAYFSEIEKIIAAANQPVLVLGDFNSVPWEDHFEQFLENTNLKSTLEGYGYKMTWPVHFPLMGIPMDHILISKDQPYSDLHIGPKIGSDHYPISVKL